LRSFAYDDENQLIQVSVSNQWMSQFVYDGKMRRRIRTEFGWQSSSSNWVQTNQVLYVYDGNLVIQERDINNLPTTTYTRGKDLSGSLEGAGGIGGLLARTAQSYVDAPLAGHAFYHADGNGNVTMLINSSQAVIAKYLYDAFGNVLSKSGLLADANRYQFSSKEKDLNSGLVYYLYRYYDPNLQRWINRDPLGERGFDLLRTKRWSKHSANAYLFLKNEPVRGVDRFGLAGGICEEEYYNIDPPERPLIPENQVGNGRTCNLGPTIVRGDLGDDFNHNPDEPECDQFPPWMQNLLNKLLDLMGVPGHKPQPQPPSPSCPPSTPPCPPPFFPSPPPGAPWPYPLFPTPTN
jgi:RHS repeat-associated protein